MKKLTNLFSKEAVNSGRQLELDLAKGWAIIFMVWVHVLETFGRMEGPVSDVIYYILGGPLAAPVFMMALGMGWAYSRHTNPSELAKRGVMLLLGSWFLNLIRYGIPGLLQGYFSFDRIFEVDILNFAGLAFLFYALVKKFKLLYPYLLTSGVFFSLLGDFFRGFNLSNEGLNLLAGQFWGNDTATYFPFFNWIIFPIVGLGLAQGLKHLKDKKAFYKRFSPWMGLVGMTYLVVNLIFRTMIYSPASNYYFLGLVDSFFVVLLFVGVVGLNYGLLKQFGEQKFQFLVHLSKQINVVYFMHWITITVISTFLSLENLSNPLVFLLMLVVLLIAVVLANLWVKSRSGQGKQAQR